MRVDIPTMDCYGHLWTAVLAKAMEDALRPVPAEVIERHTERVKANNKRTWRTDSDYNWQLRARTWLASGSDDIGSFRWICDLLNIEPESVLAEYQRQREGHGGPAVQDAAGCESDVSDEQRGERDLSASDQE